jgi:hypothetical protein
MHGPGATAGAEVTEPASPAGNASTFSQRDPSMAVSSATATRPILCRDGSGMASRVRCTFTVGAVGLAHTAAGVPDTHHVGARTRSTSRCPPASGSTSPPGVAGRPRLGAARLKCTRCARPCSGGARLLAPARRSTTPEDTSMARTPSTPTEAPAATPAQRRTGPALNRVQLMWSRLGAFDARASADGDTRSASGKPTGSPSSATLAHATRR